MFDFISNFEKRSASLCHIVLARPSSELPFCAQDDGRLAVLFNKYALEQEGLAPENDQRSPDGEDAAEPRP